MTIGERIKARRKELKLSQREMAARLGYTDHTTLTRIEAGKVDLPQSRIMKIAEVLGVTPGYLLGLVSKEDSEKNDQLAKLIVKMRTDSDFYNTVLKLSELNEKQYQGVQQLIAAFHE
jgi:transcriptional regulator with XRE-family HTH domain